MNIPWPRLFAVLLSLLAGLSAGASMIERAIADAEKSGTLQVFRTADGRLREIRGLRVPVSAGTREETARSVLASAAPLISGVDGRLPELALERVTESLIGSHLTFRHRFRGVDVVDSEAVVTISRDGFITAVSSNLSREPGPAVSAAAPQTPSADGLLKVTLEPDQRVIDERLVGITIDGAVVVVKMLIVTRHDSHEVVAFYVDDAERVLRQEELFFNASGRVFDPNPVSSLNDTSLRDMNDAASAVPESSYFAVDLPDLGPSGNLSGPNVRIVDTESPTTMRADASAALVFDRDQDPFEEVMAYFHLDRSQRYLQSLGYTGARRIIAEPIDVDAHGASGQDNSFFVTSTRPGIGRLVFGDGGVDDAEDSDILLHEYGHAIQESIAPGVFFGARAGQPRAMGEGFGDYWAFSAGYGSSLASGRDPFCVGDWDARCGGGNSTSCGYPAGADCLRRTDSSKTMDDFQSSGGGGTEHRNGEIWSSALRRIFVELVSRRGLSQGRRIADVLVLEGYFGLTTSATFRDAASRMIAADRQLFAGANVATICQSMVTAKIFQSQECVVERRGDLTLLQSPQANIPIPDNAGNGIRSTRRVTTSRIIEDVHVQVRIDHPAAGELSIRLIAPDGRSVLLSTPGTAGGGIATTFGLETPPAEPLSILRGMNAQGDWTLEVIDASGGNAGMLVSWGLILRFQGDQPLSSRPAALSRREHLLVVASAPGAAGTNFVTDVRLLNRGSREASLWAVFTPSGSDGTQQFSALQLQIAPSQTLSLDDVVATLFGTTGTGTLEFHGDIEDVLVTSRTYNRGGSGTFGQFIGPSAQDAVATTAGARLHVSQLQNTSSFRANLGVTNLSAEAGTVRVVVFDGTGTPVESRDVTLAPFGHQQFPILGGLGGRNTPVARAEVSVIAGNASVAAYGSVVDNVSGDSIFIPAVNVPVGGEATLQATFRGDGANGARWRTDLWLSNPSGFEQSPTILFYDAAGVPMGSATVHVRAGETIAHLDVLNSLLGVGAGFGKLTISSSSLIVTSRIWTPGQQGSFGQFVAARRADRSIGAGDGESTVIQLEISPAFRTNVGFTELSGQPATVRLRVLDSGGTVTLTRDLEVRQNGQVQVNLEQLGAPRGGNLRATFEVIAGGGRIVAYGSVIDNRSSDPIFVPAR